MSLQRENSEPAESEDSRPSRFSSEDCSSEAEWLSVEREGVGRLRRGMAAEVCFEEGIVPVVKWADLRAALVPSSLGSAKYVSRFRG